MAWINLAKKPEGKVIDAKTCIRWADNQEPIDDINRLELLHGGNLINVEYLDETAPTYGYSREQVESFISRAFNLGATVWDSEQSYEDLLQEFMSTIPAPQQEQDGWVSVKDRLPEKDKPILCIDKWGYMTVCGYDSILHFYPKISGEHPNFISESITHWRELPTPPKQ